MNKNNIDLSKIDTMILAGGLGTRLKSVLGNKPKCLAPINGKPFIDILLDNCIQQGLRRFILCVGYLKEQVMEHLEDRKDCEIVFSVEEELLGTGGALKNAEKYIKTDRFFVLNGDTFLEVNYNKLIDWHYKKNPDIMIVINYFKNVGRHGSVKIDSNSKIIGFIEKGINQGYGWFNAGVYLMVKSIFKEIEPNINSSLEFDLFPNFIGKSIYGYKYEGDMMDIGTLVSYDEAQLKLREKL